MFINLAIWHLLVLVIAAVWMVAVVVAIVVTAKDARLPVLEKVIWAVVLVVFPVVGLLVWGVDRLIGRPLSRGRA